MGRTIDTPTYPEAAGALSLTAMGGGDGEVPSVGDGAAEVEAKVVLEGVKRLLVNVIFGQGNSMLNNELSVILTWSNGS